MSQYYEKQMPQRKEQGRAKDTLSVQALPNDDYGKFDVCLEQICCLLRLTNCSRVEAKL